MSNARDLADLIADFDFPASDGTSGQVLTTDGSGSLSFANEGKILQVQSVTYTGTTSQSVASGGVFTPGILSVSITPSSTASKILVMASITFGTNVTRGAFRIRRNGSTVGDLAADASGSKIRATALVSHGDNHPDTTSIQVIDSPSTTSSTTYSIGLYHGSSATQTMHVNRRPSGEQDNNASHRGISSIVVMEIGE